MKNKGILPLLVLFFACIFYSKIGYASYKKEVSGSETSFLLLHQEQLSSELKYERIVNLIEEEEYDQALSACFELLEELDSNDFLLKFKIESEIATIFTRTNNFDKSLKYYKQALQTLLSGKDLDNENTSLFDKNLIETYYQIGSQFFKLDKSGGYNQSYLDSAKFYYKKVENFPSLNADVLDVKGRTFTNLSGLYFMDSIFDLAESYALKAIDIHKKRNNKLSQAGALNNLGNYFLEQNKLDKAKQTYLEGINLIRDDESSKAVEFKADLYYNLAWVMRKLEDYKAFDQLEKSYQFTDQIRDKEVKKIIETITARYNVEKVTKEAEIAERNFWIYVGISLLIMALLASAVYLYYQRKQRLALELENAEMVQKQKVDAVRSESQKRILNAIIEGKEKERKEISETLHDSVSTLLSSANLHLQASAKKFEGEPPIEIIKTKRIITEASTKIRDLSHNLISAILIKFGLTYAVKDLAQKYSNSEMRIDTDVRNVGRYAEKFEIKVYNIIQEFINNILKHSNATRAYIKMEEVNKKVKILIYDNGVGFDLNLLDKKEGIGIKQIEARVQLMHGEFKIESILNKGTQIEISIPALDVSKPLVSV